MQPYRTLLPPLLAALLIPAGATLAPAPARAVVINDPDGLTAALSFGDQFDSVLRLVLNKEGGGQSVCSGTLISPTAVLTARHCTDGKTSASARVTTGAGAVVESRSTTSWTTLPPGPSEGTADQYFDGSDVAILSFSTPFTSADPLRLLDIGDLDPALWPSLLGETAIVGYGYNGIGSTGGTVLDTKRRAATNSVDVIDTNGMLWQDFDSGLQSDNSLSFAGSSRVMTTLEGMGAPGDSGGGLLTQIDGEWVVVGLMTGGTNATNFGYGTIGYWSGVQTDAARALIEPYGTYWTPPAVPLPMSWWLLGTAVGALALAGRRRG